MESGRLGVEYQGPAVGDLHRSTGNPAWLPPAHVRTVVHVQHLPCNVTSFRQINDSVGDILRVGNGTHWRKAFQEILRVVPVHRGVDDSGGDGVETYVILRVFARETEGNRVKSALGDHRDRRRTTRHWVVNQCRCDACHTPARALQQHLPDGQLGYEDEPFQVGGDEIVKLIGGVFGEGFACEDARVVDHVVDRAELGDRGLCDVLSGCRLPDVTVDECEVRRRRETGTGDVRRGCNRVVATIQKGVYHGCSNALRGAGHDHCFLVCHSQLLLPLFAERSGNSAAGVLDQGIHGQDDNGADSGKVRSDSQTATDELWKLNCAPF